MECFLQMVWNQKKPGLYRQSHVKMVMVDGEATNTTCEKKKTLQLQGLQGRWAHDETQVLIKSRSCKDFHGRDSGRRLVCWRKCGNSRGLSGMGMRMADKRWLLWDDTHFQWPCLKVFPWWFISDECGDESSKECVLWEYSQFCSQLDHNKVAHNTEAEEMLHVEGLIIPRTLDGELT